MELVIANLLSATASLTLFAFVVYYFYGKKGIRSIVNDALENDKNFTSINIKESEEQKKVTNHHDLINRALPVINTNNRPSIQPVDISVVELVFPSPIYTSHAPNQPVEKQEDSIKNQLRKG
jgi:hypothetical protein